MKINVLTKATAYNQDFKKGVQEVGEYYANCLLSAGVAVLVEEVKKVEPKKEEPKKTTKSKK